MHQSRPVSPLSEIACNLHFGLYLRACLRFSLAPPSTKALRTEPSH
jgi:hypothetical protein